MALKGPLSAAEHAQRQAAGKASAEARHRAETTPSVHQGSTGAPSRQAVGLFRQGQARSDTRSSRSVWDNRATEAPVSAMNATVKFHLPRAYRGTPDRPKVNARALMQAQARLKGVHQDAVVTNPGTLAEAHRHPQMREIIDHVGNVVRDHQGPTIERAIQKGLIPEGTPPGLVVRAYKHAALRAIHKLGLIDYDHRMSSEARAELKPLHSFLYYSHRRVFDHLNQGQGKGKWAPFRNEFGQLFRSKKHGAFTGQQRMRMRPAEDFFKIDLGDLSGDVLAKIEEFGQALAPPKARLGGAGLGTAGRAEPGHGRAWQGWASQGKARQGGGPLVKGRPNPSPGDDNPLELARKAIQAANSGQRIPDPPAGLAPILGASLRQMAQLTEVHHGAPFMTVPRMPIAGAARKRPDGLYQINGVQKAAFQEIFGYDPETDTLTKAFIDYTTDPSRQLNRAIHPRIRRRLPRLRLNTQRHLRRLLSGGITRQERWQLGAGSSSAPFGKMLKRDVKGGPGRLLTEADVRAAARSVKAPSKAQAEAGNYRMGHVYIDGLDVSIETPKGRLRRGVGPTGRPWSVKMPAHYGYIKKTTGADGDHLDVYLGPNAHEAQDCAVHVVDQHNHGDGTFDEHKCLLGFPSRQHAIAAYDAAFSDGHGPDRRRAVHTMGWQDFKRWVGTGDTTTPLKKNDPPETHDLRQHHGHVTPVAGGRIKARCGGPATCSHCQDEWREKYGAEFPQKGTSNKTLEKSLLAGIAGAAAAGTVARQAARAYAKHRIKLTSHQIFTDGLKHALRDHLRVVSGGTPGPHVALGARNAFRAAKLRALKDAQAARRTGYANIRSPKLIAGAALAGGAAGLYHNQDVHHLPKDFYTRNDQP